MNEQIKTDKPIIDPIYCQNEPNQPIELGQVAVKIEYQGKTYENIANATMVFLPDDKLKLTVPFDDHANVFEAWSKGDLMTKLTLTERNVTLDCVWATANDGKMSFSPLQSAITVTQSCCDISTAHFHLFNFPNFSGPDDYILQTGKPPHLGAKACGRVVLEADGWIITIAATDRTDGLENQLKAQGGHVITHMGQIIRKDGATFTSEQLEEILTCLTYFLSLTLGCWAGVDLPIGFDCNRNRVYERWGLGKADKGPWKSFCSWFHPRHAESLSQVFPGFVLLWKNTLWRTPLAHALYWYIGACKGGAGSGVDTGIILAQAALELLAWTYCVKDRKMVSSKAFEPRRLSASDKLRLLASFMDIPTTIPPGLSSLIGRPGKKWDDGMEAITSIRNSLVHPDSRWNISRYEYSDTYLLSLWFINMVFLRLCDHNGRYANRLPTSSGILTFDKVPWANDNT